MMKWRPFLVILLLALAGCGGGSEETQTVVSVPAAATAPSPPAMPPDVARVVRNLQASSSGVRRDAAKLACRSYSRDPHVLQVANRELLNGYTRNMTDRVHIDAMAWLCKTLAASGKKQYAETLRKVVAGTSNRKLIKYAKESLRQLE
ncbi:hypothetical protein [Trichloromonas sp.]|uniref:hypothetical protein n=1 Tax=Trichloromonas sp. TaxID=3069249 RepID=UPI003D817403